MRQLEEENVKLLRCEGWAANPKRIYRHGQSHRCAVAAPSSALCRISHHPQPIRADARAKILDALAKGRRWLQELASDSEASIKAIAKGEGRGERSVGMLLSLAFLAPDIVRAIIDGTLPRGIRLTRLTDLPMDWSQQHRMLGLAIPGT